MASDAIKRLRATNTDQLLPSDFRALLDIAEAAQRFRESEASTAVAVSNAKRDLFVALSRLGGNDAN